MRATRDPAAVKAALAALTETARGADGNLLDLAIKVSVLLCVYSKGTTIVLM